MVETAESGGIGEMGNGKRRMETGVRKMDLNQWLERFSQPKLLFVASLLLHVIAVLAVGHYRHPMTWENGGITDYLLAGKGFAHDFSRTAEPTSWQAPGYPYLLYWMGTLFGKTPLAYLFISLGQAVVVASMVFPLSWLVARWFGEETARWARLIVCVMPLLYWYPTRIHHTAIVMAFHPWLLWGWLTLAENPKGGWRAVLTGLGTGLAGLFQPVLLAVFGLLSGVLLLNALRKRLNAQVAWIFGAGLLTLLVLTPWTIRNQQVHGRLLLVKNSFGKEFWMGNNPHATGTAFVEGGGEEVTNQYPPKAFELRGKVSEMELMQAMQDEAMEYVRAEPVAFVQRTLKKMLWLWTMPPARYLRSSGEAEALTMRWLHIGYWAVFLVFTTVALWGPKPWPFEYKGVLGLYCVIYSLVYGLTHVGQARFRGEIEFVFVPAVALGWAACWQCWQKKRRMAAEKR